MYINIGFVCHFAVILKLDESEKNFLRKKIDKCDNNSWFGI